MVHRSDWSQFLAFMGLTFSRQLLEHVFERRKKLDNIATQACIMLHTHMAISNANCYLVNH